MAALKKILFTKKQNMYKINTQKNLIYIVLKHNVRKYEKNTAVRAFVVSLFTFPCKWF